MNRIIVPLDGSATSETAVRHGARLARTLQVPLLLVHIIDTSHVYDAHALAMLPQRPEIERYLGDVAVREGIHASTELDVRFGSPSHALLGLSLEWPGAMIVMTTHGRGGLRRMVLGSVADRLVRDGTLPVMLVHADTDVESSLQLTNLLVTLDGSDLAERILPLTAVLARRFGAEVQLLRVVEPLETAPARDIPQDVVWLDSDEIERISADMEHDAHDYLSRVAASLREIGVDTHQLVTIGRPADEIVRLQRETGVDLTVMASHGFGGIRRWLMGSVTTEIIRETATPLLVVPAGMPVTALATDSRKVSVAG